jgi:methylated-DNA-[protein]-cysteine S-methyltransferase
MTTIEATVLTTVVPTPSGDLRVAVAVDENGDERLVVLAFDDHFERVSAPVRRRLIGTWTEGDTATAHAVRRYVAGDVGALDTVQVEAHGTPFQQRVWNALRAIPVGTTCSYAELAARVGAPGAVRAVGTANGANPVWLVVPCHRVVRSDGSLGGYGGGLERKAWLLAHEGGERHTDAPGTPGDS